MAAPGNDGGTENADRYRSCTRPLTDCVHWRQPAQLSNAVIGRAACIGRSAAFSGNLPSEGSKVVATLLLAGCRALTSSFPIPLYRAAAVVGVVSSHVSRAGQQRTTSRWRSSEQTYDPA